MYILTPSMLREKGYVHDEHYHTANLSAIIHTFNNWLDTHRAQFIAQAKGELVPISWLKRNDLSAYTEADIDEALVWFTKMGWEVEVVNKNSTDLVTYYVFRERKGALQLELLLEAQKISQEMDDNPLNQSPFAGGVIMPRTCTCGNYAPRSTTGVIDTHCSNCGGAKKVTVIGG